MLRWVPAAVGPPAPLYPPLRIQAYRGSAFGGAVYRLDHLQGAQSVRARDGRRAPLPDRADEVDEE